MHLLELYSIETRRNVIRFRSFFVKDLELSDRTMLSGLTSLVMNADLARRLRVFFSPDRIARDQGKCRDGDPHCNLY